MQTAQFLSISVLCKKQVVHSAEFLAQMGVGSGTEEKTRPDRKVVGRG